MTTELTLFNPDKLKPEQIALVKNISAPKATNEEFSLLLYRAKTSGLDPLNREIYCIKYDEKAPAQIFASYHGILKIANQSGNLDGIETEEEKDDKGNIIAITAKVYKKTAAHPFTAKVLMSEYVRNTQIWKEKPVTMLRKVAEVQALRKAFPLPGLYTEEEMPEPRKMKVQDEYGNPVGETETPDWVKEARDKEAKKNQGKIIQGS